MDGVWAALIGLAAGVASGVAGIGGGIIMIPAMVFVLGMEQHLAQGTSTLAILFTAVAGTMVNARNRRVDLRVALVVGLGGSAAAFFASRAAVALDAAVLQRLFGLLVLYSGARMGVRAWRARTPG
jgi:hypothetical protein